MTDDNTTGAQPFDAQCAELRISLKAFYPTLKALRVLAQEATPAANAGDDTMVETQEEMEANIVLALRHIEDTSMRLGKAIQAYNGGQSPLDSTMGNTTNPALVGGSSTETDTSVSGGAPDSTASTDSTDQTQ